MSEFVEFDTHSRHHSFCSLMENNDMKSKMVRAGINNSTSRYQQWYEQVSTMGRVGINGRVNILEIK